MNKDVDAGGDFKKGAKPNVDQSIDENITDMIDKLLHESSDDNKSEGEKPLRGNKEDACKMNEKRSSGSITGPTPILCINSIPLEQNTRTNLNSLSSTGGIKISGKGKGLSLGLTGALKPDDEFKLFKKRNTLNLTPNEQEFFANKISNNLPYKGKITQKNDNISININQPHNIPMINLNDPSNLQKQIHNFQNRNNFSSDQNLLQINSQENYTTNTSSNSNHSMMSGEYKTPKIRSKRNTEETIPVHMQMQNLSNQNLVNPLMNEIDEILETKVRIYEKIDDESLQFLKGKFLMIVKTQNGSRVLQKSLNKTHSYILSIIFDEIKNNLQELLVDSYANYFCQKFYDFLENSEKVEFLQKIRNHIVAIGNSTIGTYPLQAIIDQMKTKEERKIISEAVRENLMEMSQHAQGTHVVEKVIMCFEEEFIKEIYEIVIQNFMFLACHNNGLCVTKKIVACCKSSSNLAILQKILIDNADTLVANTHGNYSIQVALDSWDYELISRIISLFYNKFFALSSQKFSSNVVEKCLERGGEAVMNKFMDEVCHKTRILELMKNPFGNYVIQKALKLSTGFYKGKMTGIIKKHIEKLHDKKLIVKWKNIIGSLTSNNLNVAAGLRRRDSSGSNNENNDSIGSNNSSCSVNSNFSGNSINSNNSQRSNNSFHSSRSFNQGNNFAINTNNFPMVNPNNVNNVNVFSNQFSPVNFNFNFKISKSAVNSPNHSIMFPPQFQMNNNYMGNNSPNQGQGNFMNFGNFNLDNSTNVQFNQMNQMNQMYNSYSGKPKYKKGNDFYPSSFN